jgi:hypothetical protein
MSAIELTFSFGQEAVHLVAQAHVNPAVPQPADLHVDLAVVDALEFCR